MNDDGDITDDKPQPQPFQCPFSTDPPKDLLWTQINLKMKYEQM